MRFYLDEMFGPLLAAQENRCVATRDYPDFAQETIRFMEQDLPPYSVLWLQPAWPS